MLIFGRNESQTTRRRVEKPNLFPVQDGVSQWHCCGIRAGISIDGISIDELLQIGGMGQKGSLRKRLCAKGRWRVNRGKKWKCSRKNES
jgi:hypothetical protein